MITNKIGRLAFGIKIAEGWLPMINSVTYRNHNPGALRTSPMAISARAGFAVFLNDDIGFTALCWDLAMKCLGKTRTSLGPNSTLAQLVKVYTAENNPVRLRNYTQIVCDVVGKNKKTTLRYFTHESNV